MGKGMVLMGNGYDGGITIRYETIIEVGAPNEFDNGNDLQKNTSTNDVMHAFFFY